MAREVVCIRCIDPKLKDVILEQVDDPNIRSLPRCPDGAPIGTVTAQAPRGGGAVGVRKKRAPSEYNLFMAACIPKRAPGEPVSERMKTCAIEYKQKKGKA